MKKIKFKREHGSVFVATSFEVESSWAGKIKPRLCAPVASRLFKLVPMAPTCTAVFTQTKPKCPKFYEMKRTTFANGSVYVELAGYRGSFLNGVYIALRQLYTEGYRYVRLES